MVCLVTATCLLGAGTAWFLLWPAYQNSQSRMYSSTLGYSRLMRTLEMAFPVVTEEVAERKFETVFHGEGTLAAQPFYVPVVPMARVTRVHVEAGDFVRKGQLMAELDPTMASLKLAAAELAVSTASAEKERVKVGSAYILAQERPEKDQIRLGTAEEMEKRSDEKLRTYRELFERGIISKTRLLDAEREHLEIVNRLKLAKFDAHMSREGVPHSLEIAENAISEAERALQHRREELAEYRIVAPADGIIERVLIREGEYNQDSGKPGFVLMSELWFEAHLDQRALPVVEEGIAADIFLEAFPGRKIQGKVERIVPVVTFNQGGPEINRPLRPRGTGSPEWPATFAVRVSLEDEKAGELLAPGMTGFARIAVVRRAPGVARSAVRSVSAGRGLVQVLEEDGTHRVVAVGVGEVEGDAVELLSGVEPGMTVLVDGHTVLRPEDKVRVVVHRPANRALVYTVSFDEEEEFAAAGEAAAQDHAEEG